MGGTGQCWSELFITWLIPPLAQALTTLCPAPYGHSPPSPYSRSCPRVLTTELTHYPVNCLSSIDHMPARQLLLRMLSWRAAPLESLPHRPPPNIGPGEFTNLVVVVLNVGGKCSSRLLLPAGAGDVVPTHFFILQGSAFSAYL